MPKGIDAKKVVKRLQNKLEKIIKEIVFMRDGGVCQVQANYPNIKISHSGCLQMDHCFSRSIKELYYDLANLTLICSTCNAAKGSNRIAVTKRDAVTVAVHEIVKNREGEDTYNRLLEIGSGLCAFQEVNKVWWLEEQIEITSKILKEMRNNNG